MMPASEAADLADITQCLQRYGQALDDRAFDVFDTVFTPDAVCHYDIEGRVTHVRMDEVKKSSRELFERFWWTQHIFSVPLIELAGDAARATCRLIATHVQVKLDGVRSTWVLAWLTSLGCASLRATLRVACGRRRGRPRTAPVS